MVADATRDRPHIESWNLDNFKVDCTSLHPLITAEPTIPLPGNVVTSYSTGQWPVGSYKNDRPQIIPTITIQEGDDPTNTPVCKLNSPRTSLFSLVGCFPFPRT